MGDKTKGTTVTLSAVQSTVNAHLAPGSLIPWQDYRITNAKTTDDLLGKQISLVANRDANGNAEGTLFLDTGYTRQELNDRNIEYYQISLQAKSLQMFIADGSRGNQKQQMDQFIILNAEDLNNTKYACYLDLNLGIHNMNATYYDSIKALRIAPNNGESLQFNQF